MGVGAGLSMYVVVVQKFTFAISSPDEFLCLKVVVRTETHTHTQPNECTTWTTLMAGNKGATAGIDGRITSIV